MNLKLKIEVGNDAKDAFNKLGLAAAEAGEHLAKLIKAMPKPVKPQYKSWQHPYKFHK